MNYKVKFAGFLLTASIVSTVILYGINLGKLSNYKILIQDTASNNEELPHPYKLYFVNAYLITNDTIRVTLLTKCNYFPHLVLKIGDSAALPIKLHKYGTCPLGWYPSCKSGGQYGVVELPDVSLAETVLLSEEYLTVSYQANPTDERVLTLIDSRVDDGVSKKHRLAVCPFPVIFMAEWTTLAQFMEMWIEHGATKFYFYYQTISTQFDAMLRIYENDPKLDIERVQWGILPIDNDTKDSDDPNKNIIRGDEIFAVNDCALRSRYEAKYIAMSDFDETFVVFGNRTLLSVLDGLLDADPNIGGFMFRSTVASYKNSWINATHPSQLDFGIYNNISVEKRTLGANQMSKMIVIPERTRMQLVHQATQYEKKEYHTRVVDPAISKMYHLRLFRWYGAKENLAAPSNELQKHVPVWNASYTNRLQKERERLKGNPDPDGFDVSLNDEKWENKGIKVMDELNRCYDSWTKKRSKYCPTRYRCLDSLPSMNSSEWLYAEDEWIVL